jgi:predicted regulator of Ras-like GTPase activity (Roadblock/LC7/MglB family)
MRSEQAVLDEIVRVPGVRAAVLVGEDDGIVIAESALDGQDTAAAAALSAHLVGRVSAATRALGHPPLSLMLLQAAGGQVFVAKGGEGLALVAVTRNDVNIGQVRLAVLDAAGRLG